MLDFFKCTTTFAIDMLLKSHGFLISGRHCSSAGADRKWAKHDMTPLTLFFQNPWYQKHSFVNFFYPFSSHPITGSSQCLSFHFFPLHSLSDHPMGKQTGFFDRLDLSGAWPNDFYDFHQEIVLNIALCGDWAGNALEAPIWRVRKDRRFDWWQTSTRCKCGCFQK